MTEEQREQFAARYGVVLTIEGRGLSLHNTLMVAHQRPGVSIVGGFQQWRKAGRMVRKGEAGLGIWFPVQVKGNGDNAEDAEENEDANGIRFQLGTVFDISQTDEMQAENEREAA